MAEEVRLSVSDCVALINQTLEYAYPSVTVTGEVGSFKINQGKFVFFDLKDETSSLGCFMMVWQLRVPLEDGMKVAVVAQPKLTAWGKFSLTVREVRPVGEGSLKRAFELLKQRLEKEGIFDRTRKRLLPLMPKHVGVISSTQAAGYADFMKIVQERWGGVHFDVAHVQVQGADAPRQVVRALEYFNQMATPPEVVVIIRGGGSADDLAAFNDEPLVRAIAGSRAVTLVGVGHEVDVSLADMAADVRAATPSNAAQLLVPDKTEILDRYARALRQAGRQVVHEFDVQQQEVQAIRRAIPQSIEQHLRQTKERYDAMVRLLVQFNPRHILQRGYALLKLQDGTIVKETPEVGAEVMVETAQADIIAGVKDVRQK